MGWGEPLEFLEPPIPSLAPTLDQSGKEAFAILTTPILGTKNVFCVLSVLLPTL